MEQIDRANRYLIRIRQIYEGVINPQENREFYADDVISFFVHCYHIRDWILQLSKINLTAEEVDAFINEHEALKICADFCNGSKHCELTRKLRTTRQPHLVYKEYRTSTLMTGSPDVEVLRGKYEILTDNGAHDALSLAEQCMKLWSDFGEKLQEVHNRTINITF